MIKQEKALGEWLTRCYHLEFSVRSKRDILPSSPLSKYSHFWVKKQTKMATAEMPNSRLKEPSANQ